MKHVNFAARLLVLTVLFCSMLTITVFAAGEDPVWTTLTKTSAGAEAEIVTDTTITDGVVALSYDSSALTYEGVEVDEAFVAMYAVNADEEGVVRISWVAPSEYDADPDGAGLIKVKFSGEVEETDISLSGSATDGDGNRITLEGEAAIVPVDTAELEALIKKAEALDSKDYTEDSWSALEKALADGKAVLNKADKTQEEVDAAAKALSDAIKALVEATPENGEIPPTGNRFGTELVVVLIVCAAAAAVAAVIVYKRRGTR